MVLGLQFRFMILASTLYTDNEPGVARQSFLLFVVSRICHSKLYKAHNYSMQQKMATPGLSSV